MDFGFFSFGDGDDDGYPDDNSMARDSLVPSGNRYEDNEEFSPYEEYQEGLEETNTDNISKIVLPTVIAVTGAMIQTETKDKKEAVETERAIEYISITEANELVNKTTEKRKLPLRPFEQYIKDLGTGKKKLGDPL